MCECVSKTRKIEIGTKIRKIGKIKEKKEGNLREHKRKEKKAKRENKRKEKIGRVFEYNPPRPSSEGLGMRVLTSNPLSLQETVQ